MKKHFTQILFLVGALAIASSAKADFPPIQIEATDTVYGAVEKAYLGYSMDIVENQLFVGAASTAVDAESGSSSVFIYNITDEGKAEQVQVIKAPTEADKKFFGYALSVTDNYLAVLATTAKKVYVYGKQADSSWSSDAIGSFDITVNTLAIDGNRLVVAEGELLIFRSCGQNTSFKMQ